MMIEFNRNYKTVQDFEVKFLEEHPNYIIGAYLFENNWIGETWSKQTGKAYSSTRDLCPIIFEISTSTEIELKTVTIGGVFYTVPLKFDYFAVDSNGDGYLYYGKPNLSEHSWLSNGLYIKLGHFNYTGNWEDSLQDI